MIPVAEAQQRILEHVVRRPVDRLPLGPGLLGLVLAQAVASDLDSPPYDKSLVDGYALRVSDATSAEGLGVVEEVAAGQVPTRRLGPGQATRTMTGAPIPEGTEAVVMHEHCELLADGRVRYLGKPVGPGQNILPQGREIRRGDTVLHADAVLRPQELGVLATVGCSEVAVYRRPSVAILSTGDELVEPSTVPTGGQIRNSNATLLSGLCARAGGSPSYLGIARDTMESLQSLVAEGLQYDLLMMTGGVSAGKRDLVPQALREAGVQSVFHQVEMKPGKPLFFGTRGTTAVFGLPGNPVAGLVGFELFVRSALRRMMGRSSPLPKLHAARLALDYTYRTDRPTYHPARVEWSEGFQVTPVPWLGSPDLRAIAHANGFVYFSKERERYLKDEGVQVLLPEWE